jgi:hypothetical protein
MRPLLDKFKRDFTVFDFGSGVEESSLGAEIAAEYPNSIVIAAEKDPIRYTPKGRFIWLQREFSAHDLLRLAQCERYDVALAMNILHWRPDDWDVCLAALRRLAASVTIQTPPSKDPNACGQEVIPAIESYLYWGIIRTGLLLGSTTQFPQHLARPIFRLYGTLTSPTLSCKDWRSTDGEIAVEVQEGYSNKCVRFKHKNNRVEPYIPGMTLTTFTSLNGQWPKLPDMEHQISHMVRPERHGDLRPWNVRIDGRTAYSIDAEPTWTGDDNYGIQECLNHIREHYERARTQD